MDNGHYHHDHYNHQTNHDHVREDGEGSSHTRVRSCWKNMTFCHRHEISSSPSMFEYDDDANAHGSPLKGAAYYDTGSLPGGL